MLFTFKCRYYKSTMHPHHGALRNDDADDDTSGGIHLLTQWYWDPVLSGHRELLQASRKNVENVYIEKVHWLLGAEVLTGGAGVGNGTGDGDTHGHHDSKEEVDDMQRVERFKREFIRAALAEMLDYPVEEWRRKSMRGGRP